MSLQAWVLEILALILLSWGMAGPPALAGTVTVQTPKLSLVIVLALTSQLSASLSNALGVGSVAGTY